MHFAALSFALWCGERYGYQLVYVVAKCLDFVHGVVGDRTRVDRAILDCAILNDG